jgi:hypothetical protein
LDALDLLSGDARTFVEKVWATRVHLHHTDPERLAGLLPLHEVDHLLTATAIRTPAVRLARDGSVLAAREYTRTGASLAGQPMTGLVDGRKVLDLFEAGATVVLQGLHRFWPPLTRLVRDLEASLGHPCQANAYLTPPGAQGFAVHRDSHDVFVFQTHGRKLWEVHDPAESTVQEVLLEPGLSMYLPSGVPHAARAQESASLHVTVGINQVTWREVLQRAVTGLLASEEYSGHVPAGYPDRPDDFTERLTRHLAGLADRVRELDAATLVREQTDRFLTSRPPALAGGLTDRLRLVTLTDDTVVRRRPGSFCVLRDEGDRLRVLLGDRSLLVPHRLREPMGFVRERRRPFTPSDLTAWLDPTSRLVLVRRLVREGLLEVGR